MHRYQENTELRRVDLIRETADERSTGLPGFGTWRGVYLFVLIVFIALVMLLKVFELAFS